MDALVDTPNLVAQIDAFGFEHLRTLERPLEPLRREEIRIRVHAASLNYRDLLVALGQMSSRISDIHLPLVPLSDCAGEVIEVGRSVDAVRLGDRVCLAPVPAWTAGQFRPDYIQSALGGAADGVLATYVSGHQRSFVKIPDTLSFEEAATLPTAALTACNALFEFETSSPERLCLYRVPVA